VAERAPAGTGLPNDTSFGFALWAAIAVVAAIAALFSLEGAVGFNLADEGYLWYGAQRVLSGEVPIRDFDSYDPGRYYWSAAIMGLLGDNGIISLRIAGAIFQSLGLVLAVLVLRRGVPRASLTFLVLAGATLLIWMLPRHKVFDVTLAIFLIAALSQLIERPSTGRYFLMGLLVGAVAIFGRNHGVYGAVASLAAMGVLTWQHRGAALVRALPAFSAGVLIGYAPLLIALLVVPNLFEAFWKDASILVNYVLHNDGGTNLALPVPWPWNANVLRGSWIDGVHRVTVGLFFLAVLSFSIAAPGYVLLTRPGRTNSVFAACAFLAVPYAHFAFSRADAPHLAQGIFPLLIGILAAPCIRSERVRLALGASVLVASVFAAGPLHSGWGAWRAGNWQSAEVGRDRLLVSPAVAGDLRILADLVDRYAANGRAFMVTPYWPGAYAVFERKAPVFDTYALIPRSPGFQDAEIARIRGANLGFVAVLDTRLDGLDERRYRKTHPLIFQFIVENFEPAPEGHGALQVYVPRQSGP
jgi:hypothetical protein